EASPHYQLVITRAKTLDKLELKLELTPESFTRLGSEALAGGMIDVDQQVRSLVRQIEHRIREILGIGVTVTLLAPGTAPRSAGGKLRRVVDERKL
ncbi:MAG TPA: phenylacetate--CoA ligase, partial [Trueperaceae bacterium]|nr:phenylacetate--CoA ligase [Trueperaceae bacterium]